MLLDSYVLITKNRQPMIRFVIRHRSLCEAIDWFEVTPPDEEQQQALRVPDSSLHQKNKPGAV